MLLIGVGGSGRHSMTRLAGYICHYKVFGIEVNKNYKKADFREGELFQLNAMSTDARS